MYLLDQPGSRKTRHDGIDHYPSSRSHHFFCSDDLVQRIVAALYQHIGHDGLDQVPAECLRRK